MKGGGKVGHSHQKGRACDRENTETEREGKRETERKQSQ